MRCWDVGGGRGPRVGRADAACVGDHLRHVDLFGVGRVLGLLFGVAINDSFDR